jgi:hypothetical protein
VPQQKKTRTRFPFYGGLLLLVLALTSRPGYTEESYQSRWSLPRHYAPSTTLTGTLGLNTIPSARMDEKGTIRLGASTSDPYVHTYMGFQLADSLYISLRQTGEISSIRQKPDHLYPGLDLKIRLFEETATRPAVAIGFESAYGHKRMGSEYLTLSKRFKNIDVTGGIAWGRLGSAGHIHNPLASLNSHFDKRRQYNLEQAQDIRDWFTGQDIGFFGGVEYFTPLKGLSFKAEYGANDYIGERRNIAGFDAPPPWSVALNYQPWEQIDLTAGIIGGEKVMARLSIQDQLFDWPGRPHERQAPPVIAPSRDISNSHDNSLALGSYQSPALQIGHKTRHVINGMDGGDEKIHLNLTHKGLRGPSVTLIKHDVEQAVLYHHGSAEEIWQDTDIAKSKNAFWDLKNKSKSGFDFRFILDTKLNITQIDTGPLYRTALLVDGEKTWPFGFISGARARVNIHDNLHKLRGFKIPPLLTTRSDEDNFADQRFAIDRLYLGWLHSINGNVHLAATAGYLEEMFTGAGGEILYRPFGKRFAIGAEGWRVYKRNPFSRLNKEFSTKGKTTGHINLYYELPNQMTTIFARAGKYLKEDIGATAGVKTTFDNGTSLEGFVTSTREYDFDLFGNSTNLYGGIKLSLPLGNIPYIPDGSEVRFATGPFARDTGQILDHPLPLYEVTEPISYRQLSRSWTDLLK